MQYLGGRFRKCNSGNILYLYILLIPIANYKPRQINLDHEVCQLVFLKSKCYFYKRSVTVTTTLSVPSMIYLHPPFSCWEENSKCLNNPRIQYAVCSMVPTRNCKSTLSINRTDRTMLNAYAQT